MWFKRKPKATPPRGIAEYELSPLYQVPAPKPAIVYELFPYRKPEWIDACETEMIASLTEGERQTYDAFWALVQHYQGIQLRLLEEVVALKGASSHAGKK